jgi:hypothetical protein
MLKVLHHDETLSNLSNNIIEYVLGFRRKANLYLDYQGDIMKIKQLYSYKFNIKPHLHIQIAEGCDFFADGNDMHKNLFIDSHYIKGDSFYTDREVRFTTVYKYGMYMLNEKIIKFYDKN